MKVKRKKLSAKSGVTYRLTGDGVSEDKTFPADADGVALSWAVGRLMQGTNARYDEKYARPGEVLANGDYLLSLVGDRITEDKFKIRKHPKGGTTLVSWGDA